MARLQAEGYDLGGLVPSSGGGGDKLSGAGEALVTALKAQEDPRVVAKGAAAITVIIRAGPGKRGVRRPMQAMCSGATGDACDP